MSILMAAFLVQTANGAWQKAATIDVPDEIFDQAMPYLKCMEAGWNDRTPEVGTSDLAVLVAARDGALTVCKPVRVRAYRDSDVVLLKAGKLSKAGRKALIQKSLSQIDQVFDSVIAKMRAAKD